MTRTLPAVCRFLGLTTCDRLRFLFLPALFPFNGKHPNLQKCSNDLSLCLHSPSFFRLLRTWPRSSHTSSGKPFPNNAASDPGNERRAWASPLASWSESRLSSLSLPSAPLFHPPAQLILLTTHSPTGATPGALFCRWDQIQTPLVLKALHKLSLTFLSRPASTRPQDCPGSCRSPRMLPLP